MVTPSGRKEPGVSLSSVVQGLKERGLDLPVLLRFSDILASRLGLLRDGFQKAIKEFDYQNEFRGVYPIKVNQQQHVIEEIIRFGSACGHGLEAGSKAELIAAISFLDNPDACLICNGYKDEEFLDLALFAIKMGIRCFIVIERVGELGMVLERAKTLGVRPLIGVRVKLSAKAGGHWIESGGDRSVYGLNMTQLLDVVDQLREMNMLDCFKLLHYHLGSQIPNIRDIRNAVAEACQIYAGLIEEGAAMGFFDLGGGLAVDYDGSHTNYTNSKNYSVDEYCADIVEAIVAVCEQHDVPHPVIITESGRATVAHSSVLLFNVLDVSRFETMDASPELLDDDHELLRNLLDVSQGVNHKNLQESFHDAIYYRDEIRQVFKHGDVGIRQLAKADAIFWHIMRTVSVELRDRKYVPDEFEKLEVGLADIYYGNFSVFQSLPDAWAIDQLFPIMPIHRLNEPPTRQAIIADITCDCDGKIDKFIDQRDVKRTLPLHPLRDDEDYILGVFIVGAYQETLGDLHNLLGDTNVVGVTLNGDGGFEFDEEIKGDSVGDVLSYVEYDCKAIVSRIRKIAEKAIQRGDIAVKERKTIMDAFETGIQGYTYFES